MAKQRHTWIHIATMGVDFGGDPGEDRWYWCSWCGVLSCNFVEYWLPNLVFPEDMLISQRTLPKGHMIEPSCRGE